MADDLGQLLASALHGQRAAGRDDRGHAWPGAIGWFMVLRRQSFAGHTLAIVSFPGAAGAILVGVSATDRLLRAPPSRPRW